MLSVNSALRSKSFTALWIGQMLSRLGDSIMTVMLPLIVYSLYGSTLTMGFVMALMIIPQVILLPLTGLLVDRVSRVKVMIITDVIRFGLLMALTCLSAFGDLNKTIIYSYALLEGTMAALFQPAYSAARAQIFTPDIRNSAISLTQMGEQLARLIGPSLGGLIVSFTSTSIGFGLDALTFLFSVISLTTLKLAGSPANSLNLTVDAKAKHSVSRFANDLLGGYRELRKHPWLWITIIVFAFGNILLSGYISILLPWFIKVHLNKPAYTYGLLVTANGIGALIMGFLFSLRQSWHKRGIITYVGSSIAGIVLLSVTFSNWVPFIILAMVVIGALMMMFGLIWEASLQELIPLEFFGRVASLDMMGSFVLLPVGYIISGWLSQYVGGITTMAGEAIIFTILCLLLLLIPAIRKFD